MRRSGLKYEHVLSFALEHPWAITDSMRGVIANILARRCAGEDADPDDVSAALVARAARVQTASPSGTVAVIPIHGVIAPRANMMSDMSGGTTFEGLTEQLHQALALPNLSAIVFDVDSPGGNAAGATEFSREVLKARTKVPVIAQAQHLMASAAYWAMSGATEIVASPSAMVGSIGVYTIYNDVSEALAKLGVKRTVISEGKYKGEGADGGPLSTEALAHTQAVVGSAYDRFVGDVAKGRGVTPDTIRHGYGEGRALTAEQALAGRMVDRIATLSETLSRVTSTGPSVGVRAVEQPAVTAQEPLPATAQEPRLNDALIAFEQRLLLLERLQL
jgi:signal peptide peptidase SppA